MEPVRFGIVSTALIARRWVIPAMQRSSLCEVVAISSRDAETARRVANEFDIPRAYGSHEELFTDPEVEAVYVATPNHLHVAQSVAAVEAGKHVLCEKPVGLDAAEVGRLIRARDAAGVQVSEAVMVRYHPRWLAARELTRSGRLGRIQQIHATYSVYNDDPGNIRFRPEMGGGALYDVGIYPVTAGRFFFEDEPVRAYANFVRDDPSGVDLSVNGVLEFPGQRSLMFSGSLRQGWAHFIHLTGTHGSMEVPTAVWRDPTLPSELRIRQRDDLDDVRIETVQFDPVNQYVLEVDAFARSARGEAQAWPLENAVASMRALDAIRKSATTGQAVDL